jgi:diguanylate cyclase (GGDEF)-like protein
MEKPSAIVGEPPVPDAVFDQLLRAYMERARSSAWSAPIGTVLLAWICWAEAGAERALFWLVLVSIPDVLTFWHTSRFRARQPGPGQGKPWLWRQFALHGVAGAAWGVAPWLLVAPQGSTEFISPPLVWLVGATALSVGSLSEFRRSILVFLCCTWMPVVVFLVDRGAPRDMQAVAGIVGLCVLSVQYADATRRQSILAIENGLRLAQTSQQLQRAREELASANLNLVLRNQALQGAVRRIGDLANHDELTRLINRREAMRRLEECVSLQSQGVRSSLVFVDIDHFKQVNDGWGHAAGDAVLMEVGERLHRTIRGSDAAARWGGEEFLVILKDTGLEAATYTAERLATAIRSTPFKVGQDQRQMTASFGVAELGPDESLEQWLGRADSACYRAKAAGRNQVAIG